MQNYIGIKQADGTIMPVLIYQPNKSQKISCAPIRDKQDKVKLDFYYIPESDLNQAQHIGTLSSKKLKNLNKGEYNIQITIKIDEKGTTRATLFSASGGTQKTISMVIPAKQTPAPLITESLPPKKWGPFRLAAAFIYGLFIIALIFFLLSNTFMELSLETLFGIKF